MQLFCFRKFGSKAGLQIHRFGGGEEGPVGRAEVQVVNLADLGPDGVQVAGFVGDFASLGMDARFIETLQRPEEVVGGLQTDGFSRVGHHGVPHIGATAGEAEDLGKIGFGVFESGAQGRVAVFVTAFGDPEAVTVGHAAKFAEERPGEFIVEMIGIVAIAGGCLPLLSLADPDHLLG